MPANEGGQTVSIKFYEPVLSRIVNERHDIIRPRGIYKGGWLSKAADDQVYLSPLVCEIGDNDYQVRVETVSTITIKNVTSDPSYIVLRWTYTGATSDYMEVLVVSSPSTNDLVVGRVIFTGGGAVNSFTYDDTDYPRSIPNRHNLFLKVEATSPASSSVRVRGGYLARALTPVMYRGVTLNLGSFSVSVYIYIDNDGTVKASNLPSSYGGKAILALVSIGVVGSTITEADITDLRAFLTPPAIPDDVTIERSSTNGKLQVKDNAIDDGKLGVITSIFGDEVTKDSLNNDLVRDAVYQATSDGYVGVLGAAFSSGDWSITFKILVGKTDPPTVARYNFSHRLSGSGRTIAPCSGAIPILKGEYFKVIYYHGTTNYNLSKYWWIPIGDGVCVKQ